MICRYSTVLAVFLCLFSVAPASANYWEGHAAFRRGDYTTAERAFARLAALGHAASQFNLGYLYHHGLAVPRDPAEGAKWYRAAAEQGQVEAQFSLGALYETGSGVPRNLVLAYRWYNLAASNQPPGQSRERLIRHRERVFAQLAGAERDAARASPAPAGFALAANLMAAGKDIAKPSVADLQRELALRKFNPGPIDGVMGRSTSGALAAFQASKSLPVTGELDPATLDKLFGPEEVAPNLEPFPRQARVQKDPTPPAVPVPPVEQVQLAPPQDILQELDPQLTWAPPVLLTRGPRERPARQLAQAEAETEPEPESGLLALIGPILGAPFAEPAVDSGEPEDQEVAAPKVAPRARVPLRAVARAEPPEEPRTRLRIHPRAPPLALSRLPAGLLARAEPIPPLLLVKRPGPRAQPRSLEVAALLEARIEAQERARRVLPPPPPFNPVDEADERFIAEANRAPVAVAASFEVEETAPAGSLLGQVSATDADEGENGELRFALSGDNSGGRFALDPESGLVTVAADADLDFENRRRFDLVYRVRDGGGQSDSAVLTIRLIDGNEPPDRIRWIATKLPETAAPGRFAGQVMGLDPDAGDRLTYALLEDAEGRFAIDPDSGVVTLNAGAALDFEAAESHELAVRVTDRGGLAHETAVTVALADVNEPPVLAGEGLTLAENAEAGIELGRVTAEDPDAEDGVVYGLANDAEGRFAIDPQSGVLRVVEGADLDFEETPRLTLVATASDRGGLTDRIDLAVDLTDRNEAPSGEVAIAGMLVETALPGTLAAAYAAQDPDADDRVTYSLTDDAGGRFAIDPDRGLIALAEGAELDFNSAPQHQVAVRVADSQGLSHEEVVTIALLEVEEAPADKDDLLVAEALDAPSDKLVTNGADHDGETNGTATNGTTVHDGEAETGLPVELASLTVAPDAADDTIAKIAGIANESLLVRRHFRRGYDHHIRGEIEKSIEAYSEVVRLAPDHFNARYNRGLSYFSLARYDRAIADFEKVLEVRPDYAGALVNRGNAYFRQGFYGQAARDYLRAMGTWIEIW